MNDDMLRLILPALKAERKNPDEKPQNASQPDDKMLILLLILLLSKEKNDFYLMLALMYIVM